MQHGDKTGRNRGMVEVYLMVVFSTIYIRQASFTCFSRTSRRSYERQG